MSDDDDDDGPPDPRVEELTGFVELSSDPAGARVFDGDVALGRQSGAR